MVNRCEGGVVENPGYWKINYIRQFVVFSTFPQGIFIIISDVKNFYFQIKSIQIIDGSRRGTG